MKNLNKLFLVSSGLLFSAAIHAGGNAQGGNTGTAKYVISVKLHSAVGELGSLKVIENLSNGSTRTLKTCDAIGGVDEHPDGANSRKTPAGAKKVYETNVNLKYNSPNGWTWIQGVNASYFEDIHGRPVAVHTGNLNSNSHACVRTSEACSSYIMSLANSAATVVAGNSPITGAPPKRTFNMVVDVQYLD